MSKRKEESPFTCFLPLAALCLTGAGTVLTVLTGAWLHWPPMMAALWVVAQVVAAIEEKPRR